MAASTFRALEAAIGPWLEIVDSRMFWNQSMVGFVVIWPGWSVPPLARRPA
jgi:hypothetical protein